MATAPLIELVLRPDDMAILRGRTFPQDEAPELHEALQAARARGQLVVLLFPGPGAVDLAEVVAGGTATPPPPRESDGAAAGYLLLAIDSTWAYAKEMFTRLPRDVHDIAIRCVREDARSQTH